MEKIELLSLRDGAKRLGKSVQVLRRMYRKGLIGAVRGRNDMLLFKASDLDDLKAQKYPEGMSHSEISARYGIKRTLVIYHFNRLGVKPLGTNREFNRTVYDERTVVKFAKILGWKELQNPTGESLSPVLATSSDG